MKGISTDISSLTGNASVGQTVTHRPRGPSHISVHDDMYITTSSCAADNASSSTVTTMFNSAPSRRCVDLPQLQDLSTHLTRLSHPLNTVLSDRAYKGSLRHPADATSQTLLEGSSPRLGPAPPRSDLQYIRTPPPPDRTPRHTSHLSARTCQCPTSSSNRP